MQRIQSLSKNLKKDVVRPQLGINIERRWLGLRDTFPLPNLRIMSYNLLSKNNIMEHHFPYHNESDLDSILRNKKLRAFINQGNRNDKPRHPLLART